MLGRATLSKHLERQGRGWREKKQERVEKGKEQREEVKQEEKEKKGHREARSGEPDSMPRLATEGRQGPHVTESATAEHAIVKAMQTNPSRPAGRL